jgi:hypothetical protein
MRLLVRSGHAVIELVGSCSAARAPQCVIGDLKVVKN